jgi:rubrerythrin
MNRFNQLITSFEVALDLAIWLEKKGAAFYREARDATGDNSAKKLFAWLADEEVTHCETYQELYTAVKGEPPIQEELVGEYGHFINLLIREILADFDLASTDTPDDILQKALAFETAALRYFQEIRARFSGEQGRVIDLICAEEQTHIDKLMAAAASA